MYVLRLTPLLAGAALVGRAGHAAGKDMRINRRVAAAAVAALTSSGDFASVVTSQFSEAKV